MIPPNCRVFPAFANLCRRTMLQKQLQSQRTTAFDLATTPNGTSTMLIRSSPNWTWVPSETARQLRWLRLRRQMRIKIWQTQLVKRRMKFATAFLEWVLLSVRNAPTIFVSKETSNSKLANLRKLFYIILVVWPWWGRRWHFRIAQWLVKFPFLLIAWIFNI